MQLFTHLQKYKLIGHHGVFHGSYKHITLRHGIKEFDNITNKMGFSSRSDAVREALHRFVAQNKWIEHIDSGTPFIATIVYDDKREQPVHNIIHDFKNIVKSATHTHFGDRCAEWVILQGDNDSIKQFVERISAIKDVMVCRCSV